MTQICTFRPGNPFIVGIKLSLRNNRIQYLERRCITMKPYLVISVKLHFIFLRIYSQREKPLLRFLCLHVKRLGHIFLAFVLYGISLCSESVSAKTTHLRTLLLVKAKATSYLPTALLSRGS